MSQAIPVTIQFDEHTTARAVRVPPDHPPRAVLAALDLPPCRGVIAMHGGAGRMEPELVDTVRDFLAASLAPFAQQRGILVIDGGTAKGTMAAMGAARQMVGGTYPLVGVCPIGTISYPGGPAPDDDHSPLDPHHSHFIFVEGSEFGSESGMFVSLLRAAGVPGFALVINGGMIVAHEVQMHASLGNPLVVVRGSGRLADQLTHAHSPERAALPPDTRLEIVDLGAPQAFSALLGRLLP